MEKTKIGWFVASFSAWMISFVLLLNTPQIETPPAIIPPQQPQHLQQPPPIPVEPDCIGVQVQIPKNCRVPNRSGSQCVWCSIECLCRFHGLKEVYEGEHRITKHYTWGTGPGEVQRVLNTKYPTVKWKQIQSRSQMKSFIKKYVTEKKFGVGLGIPGHMLNLVHYDEEKGIVKIIDNGGSKALQVQDWTMEKFNRLADGWVLTIFPKDYNEKQDDHMFDCTLTDPFKIYGRFTAGNLSYNQ